MGYYFFLAVNASYKIKITHTAPITTVMYSNVVFTALLLRKTSSVDKNTTAANPIRIEKVVGDFLLINILIARNNTMSILIILIVV